MLITFEPLNIQFNEQSLILSRLKSLNVAGESYNTNWII